MRTLGFFLMAFAMATFLGCTKEQMNANKMEGYWDITECEYDDEDFTEAYNMTLLFLEYKDGEGEVVWTWEATGERNVGYIFTGTWELNDEADEITMEMKYSSEMDADLVGDLTIDKDEMEIEGTLQMTEMEEVEIVMKAEKRE